MLTFYQYKFTKCLSLKLTNTKEMRERMKPKECLYRWGVVGVALIALTGNVRGSLLYSDEFKYFDDGQIVVTDNINGGDTTIRTANPSFSAIHGTPTGLLALKIQEDVIQYDPVVHPFVSPGMDRYVYTISNLGYDSGNVPLAYGSAPGVGVNGVSGFNIVNQYNVTTTGMGTPNDPVTGNPWIMNGFSSGPRWEWDIRPNPPDPLGGEGIGSPFGPPSPVTMNGFWFEVASGTPHGIVPMWVHSWDQSALQVNIWDLVVSAPIPEPASFGLIGLITILGLFVRRIFQR